MNYTIARLSTDAAADGHRVAFLADYLRIVAQPTGANLRVRLGSPDASPIPADALSELAAAPGECWREVFLAWDAVPGGELVVFLGLGVRGEQTLPGQASVFEEAVHTLALDVAQDQGTPLEIDAARWNTYTAVVPSGAEIYVRCGSPAAGRYSLAAVPQRRASAVFGALYLDWPAQVDTDVTLILGRNEDTGIR